MASDGLWVSGADKFHCRNPAVHGRGVRSFASPSLAECLGPGVCGVQDVFTNEEARTLALEKFNGELTRTSSSKMAVKKAASSLAKAALAKGSRDNVTVVVVDLRQPGGAGHHATARASGAATPNPGATAAGSGPTMTAAGPPAASAAPAQPKQQPASPVTPEVVSDADD